MKIKKEAQTNKFADFMRNLRKEKRITLRKFCIKAGADPANISRLENGCLPPPKKQEILERYAKALDIKEGSDEWYEYFDLAAIDSGIIPKSIMEDKEVSQLLPAFFRTVRNQKPTEEELEKLVDKIRRI